MRVAVIAPAGWLREAVHMWGKKKLVEVINELGLEQGSRVVICTECLEPELQEKAWWDDGGPLCRCCGRAKRLMKETLPQQEETKQ